MSQTPKATILVVDDAAGDLALAKTLLEEKMGARVITAANGAKAVEHLKQSSPDAVVTDLFMPDMDGMQLLKHLRVEYPHLPVVLMTGHGNEEVASEALRRGAASYVPKRHILRDLVRTVEKVLTVGEPERNLQKLFECTRQVKSHYLLDTDPSLVTPLVSHLQSFLVPMGICDVSGSMQVGIALVEALSNAIYHGNLELDSDVIEREEHQDTFYKIAGERRLQEPYVRRKIDVTVDLTPEQAVYIIRDQGPGFDPSSVPDPSDPMNIEKLSGRGLLLIRTFMDEVCHNEKGNEITMIKRRVEPCET